MNRLVGISVLALAFGIPAYASGQENYTMKFKSPSKGDTARVQKVDTEIQKLKVTDDTGVVLDNKDEKTVTTMHYVETILELPDPEKDPTKLKRIYEKAEIKKGAEVTTSALQGKTVFIERKDGAYQFNYEDGGKLAEDDFKILQKEFKDDKQKKGDFTKHFLPSDTVKIGEEWKIPGNELVKELLAEAPFVVDMAKVTAVGKLAKVTKKDGSDVGELVFKVTLPIKALKVPDIDVEFKPPAVFSFDFTVVACIDGTRIDGEVHMTGMLTGIANLEAGGMVFHMDISSGIVGDWTVAEVRKK